MIIKSQWTTSTWAIIIVALHTKIRYNKDQIEVNKEFSFKSDPCTSLPSPHQHRWSARVEKLVSQAYICAFTMTPGGAHTARMKIFINEDGDGGEETRSFYLWKLG